MSRTTAHWSPTDVSDVLLAEARRPDAAEPVAIHVRPELLPLLRRRTSGPTVEGSGSPGVDQSGGIPVVVDPAIPVAPGFEIHRRVWQERSASLPPYLPVTGRAA